MMARWAAFVVCCSPLAPIFAHGQATSYDVNTLLHDSSYVMNRFGELSTGLAVKIDAWNAPASLKQTSKEALLAVERNVEAEKPALNRLIDKHAQVASSDLLDVYSEMVEVTAELQGSASDSANFGDERMSEQLAELGAKAQIISAKIGVALREQVVALELQVASCSLSAPPATPKR